MASKASLCVAAALLLAGEGPGRLIEPFCSASGRIRRWPVARVSPSTSAQTQLFTF